MSAIVIEVESIDGAGKTTVHSYIIKKLREKGKRVLDTREVGNPHLPVCVELRKLVLNPTSKLDGKSMEFIFAAMRIENQKFYETVKNDYDYIVSDRGLLSHLAYTDHNVNTYFTDDFYGGVVMPLTRNPDLVLFLEIDPETALKRRNARNGFVDAIEAKGPEFQRKVYSSFIKYIRKLETNENLQYRFIDANGTIEEVQQKLDFVIETSLS